MRPGDLIRVNQRIYKVTGIYLGAEGQENVYGLVAIGLKKPTVGATIIDEMTVPCYLLDALNLPIYREVR